MIENCQMTDCLIGVEAGLKSIARDPLLAIFVLVFTLLAVLAWVIRWRAWFFKRYSRWEGYRVAAGYVGRELGLGYIRTPSGMRVRTIVRVDVLKLVPIQEGSTSPALLVAMTYSGDTHHPVGSEVEVWFDKSAKPVWVHHGFVPECINTSKHKIWEYKGEYLASPSFLPAPAHT